MARVGVNGAGARAALKEMDVDGDGQISYEEFLTAVVDRQLVQHQQKVWWAFCEYDLDGDGKITREELQAALALHGESPERLNAYIAEFDLDGDGALDYHEFMKMLLPREVAARAMRRTVSSNAFGGGGGGGGGGAAGGGAVGGGGAAPPLRLRLLAAPHVVRVVAAAS